MKKKTLRRIVYLIDICLIVFMSLLIFNEYQNFKKKKLINYASSFFEENLIKEVGNNKITTKDGDYKYVVNNLEFDNIDITKLLLDNYKRNYSDTYNYYLDYEVYEAPDNIISIVIYEVFENKSTKEIYEFKSFYNYSSDIHDYVRDTYIFKGNYESHFLEIIDEYINSKTMDYHININKAEYHFLLLKDHIKLYVDYLIPQSIIINIPYETISEYLNINVNNKLTNDYNNLHEKRIINGECNVYEKADKNSKRIGILKKGEQVYVIGQIGEFSKIMYQDRMVYVLSSSLLNTKENNNYKDTNDIVYVVKKGTYLYTIDDTGSKTETKLEYLTALDRIGISEEWSKVIYKNEIYFIPNKYLFDELVDIIYEID